MNRVRSPIIARLAWLALGFITVLLLLIACLAAVFSGGSRATIFLTETQALSDGWADAEGNELTLPVKLPYPVAGVYVLERTLTKDQTHFESLLFSAKYLNVRLYLDGEELGSCLGRPEGWEKTSGKAFLLVPLPNGSEGKTLRIEAVPLIGDKTNYEIVAPVIGYSGKLANNIVRYELPLLITISIISSFGILLFLFGFQARAAHNTTLMQTGIFAMVFAFYSISITDTIHLFVASSYFIYILEFLTLALLALPLLVLVYHVCMPKFKKLILADICAVFLNFCLQVFLQFVTRFELRDSVVLTHIILGASVILLVPVLALSSRHGRDKSWLLLSFSPVLVGAIWDLCRFYLPNAYQKAVGFQLGVLLFLLLQSVSLIRSYFEYYKTHLETDVYRHIAYTDALTELRNRAAFEERLLELNRDRELYQTIFCICADINNLKHVNDTQGHCAGDELIRGAAQVLRETMCESCELYRTGGDEFVLFSLNQAEAMIVKGRARLDVNLARHNKGVPLKLSIAVGYDRLLPGGEDTISRLVSRADARMYEDKRLWKEQHPEGTL